MKNSAGMKENLNTTFRAWYMSSSQWSMDNFHYHDNYEIYLCMSDHVQSFVEGKVYDLKKGDLLVFNNHDLHRTHVVEPMEYKRYCAVFLIDFVEDFISDEPSLLDCFCFRTDDFQYRISLDNNQLEQMQQLFDQAVYYCNNDVFGSTLYKKMVLLQMLMLINPLYKNAVQINYSAGSRIHEKVKPVIEYINHNLGEDLSIEVLSRQFYLSRQHLSNVFKAGTRFSIKEYVINRRILKACELLKSNFTVSQVRERIGYKNDAHFIRTFKRITGTTPKQYGLSHRDR